MRTVQMDTKHSQWVEDDRMEIIVAKKPCQKCFLNDTPYQIRDPAILFRYSLMAIGR